MLAKKNKHIRDKDITFKERSHTYNVKGDTGYTSVTKKVHALFEPFDADKIIDRMMNSVKWEFSPYFGMTKHAIKSKWKKDGAEASKSGTAMHLMFENYYNGIDFQSKGVETDYFRNFVSEHQYLVPYRTEWKVYDKDKRLTGTIDMVFINDDGTLSIYDWKRCKSIDHLNNFNKFSICEKISDIPDTNYWHYSLQLNLYKYILEQNYGFIVKDMYLVQIHPNQDNYKKINVPILTEATHNILS
jgi:ATP-dependent exoDNAse (exonuclease V) beta subunit